jgi:DNA-binding NarL/FixJ family response regulator
MMCYSFNKTKKEDTKMIRVIIADDHNLMRRTIRALLEKANDIKVIAEAKNGYEAINLVEHMRPDVLVMDITMPFLNGIRATERICCLKPATQVVILSLHGDEAVVQQAVRNGVRGYVLKRSATAELLPAVRAAKQGQPYLSSAISDYCQAPVS